jgi:hypothetical protein
MKKPEERKEEKETEKKKQRKRNRRKKLLQFLPILVQIYQLERCSTAFLITINAWACVDTHRA